MAVIPVHLTKLFRPLEPKVLRPWLVDECPALDDDALWQAPTRKAVRDQVLPVLTAHLAPAEVRRLDQNAERVALVADRAGREAWDYCRATLVERVGADWVAAVEGGGNGYFRALALLRTDPRLFTQVEGVRATDELRGGRLYSGFRVPKEPALLHVAPVTVAFEAALDQLFDAQGEIVSEPFEQIQEQDDGTERTLWHWHVVHKGLEDDYETLEDKEIVSKAIFPAHHLRLVYLPDEGLLEVYAHQRNLRPEIARLFLIHVLGQSGQIELVPERRYTLERLRDATPLPIAPEDAYRVASAELMEARFAVGGKGSTLTLHRGSKEPRTLYQLAFSAFGERDPFRGLNPITRVRIVLRLRKTGPSDPARSVPIVITLPNACNIRHRCDGDQKLGEKYLRLWGLVLDDKEPAPDAIPNGLADAAPTT